MKCSEHNQMECDSCIEAGIHTQAVGHSKNPDWSNYDLCEGCISEYDARPPVAETL